MESYEQVREGCQHVRLAAILGKTSQPRLLKTKLPLWPPADIV
jgi:hypothetical protein